MAQGRCMKCRTNVEIQNAKEVITKNKMKMLRGTCPDCQTTVCRITGKA